MFMNSAGEQHAGGNAPSWKPDAHFQSRYSSQATSGSRGNKRKNTDRDSGVYSRSTAYFMIGHGSGILCDITFHVC